MKANLPVPKFGREGLFGDRPTTLHVHCCELCLFLFQLLTQLWNKQKRWGCNSDSHTFSRVPYQLCFCSVHDACTGCPGNSKFKLFQMQRLIDTVVFWSKGSFYTINQLWNVPLLPDWKFHTDPILCSLVYSGNVNPLDFCYKHFITTLGQKH